MQTRAAVASAATLIFSFFVLSSAAAESQRPIEEIELHWPNTHSAGDGHCAQGSTHELHSAGDAGIWVTNQTNNHLAHVTLDGKASFFELPAESGPHGIDFDGQGRLWISLEFAGEVRRIEPDGTTDEIIDVRMQVIGSKTPLNPYPHGIAFGPDGKTLWFTGKKTSTIGRIDPDGRVEHFELPSIGAVPIYLAAGPDGNMWCTELVGNHIARIQPNGEINEIKIPTANSRPIAIVPGPDGKSMWFSEEAGNKVARIDIATSRIVEFRVPKMQDNVILAGIAFDDDGNLWTQSYVPADAHPAGDDHIVKIDEAAVTAAVSADSGAPVVELPDSAFTFYRTPSRSTVMHRITQGADGNMWFTELSTDILGKLKMPN